MANKNYGTKDQIEGNLLYSDAKIKVSMFLDGDLLKVLKEQAVNRNTKYQTLINQTLRDLFMGQSNAVDPIEFKNLKTKVDLLESIVLKKIA